MESKIINGVERFCGLLPTPPEVRRLFVPKTVGIIPEKEWRIISNQPFFGKPKNQSNQGSCVGASGVKILMMTILRDLGIEVDLSIGSLYGQINGGRDAGASLGDAYVALQETGCCTTATIGEYDWKKARNSSAWKEEAKKYRMPEGVLCQSVEEFCTWLQLGFIGQMGLASSTIEPNSGGFSPGGRGSLDHALVACGMLIDSKGRAWIEGGNSWGDWGPLHGMFYYPVDSLPLDELWIARTTVISL